MASLTYPEAAKLTTQTPINPAADVDNKQIPEDLDKDANTYDVLAFNGKLILSYDPRRANAHLHQNQISFLDAASKYDWSGVFPELLSSSTFQTWASEKMREGGEDGPLVRLGLFTTWMQTQVADPEWVSRW